MSCAAGAAKGEFGEMNPVQLHATLEGKEKELKNQSPPMSPPLHSLHQSCSQFTASSSITSPRGQQAPVSLGEMVHKENFQLLLSHPLLSWPPK